MSAQREWFPASELAGLPGLASSKRGVQMQADAAAWRHREVTGRGGLRREYHISALPALARAALVFGRANVLVGGQAVGQDVVQQQAVATAQALGMTQGQRAELTQSLAQRAVELAQAEGLKAAAHLDAKSARRMDARLAVLAEVQRFAEGAGLAMTVAEQQYAMAWSQGGGGVAEWVRAELGSVSASSLQRWRLAVKEQGIRALAGNYGNRRGSSLVSGQEQVRAFVEAMLVQHPHARASHVRAGLCARMGAQIESGEVELPSMRSIERWVEHWREANREVSTALSNPDAWKNKYMVAFGSQSEGVVRVNQRWEMDSTPGDVMLTDGRHTLLGVVDVFTRRARLLVLLTSRATAVCSLLRATLLTWGVPEEVKTDNGSDYVSNHTVRVLQGLDVTHTLCPPFQPQHKPHIERFFGTMSRALMELLQGYIGHNVAERSAIEARKSFAERLMTRGEVVEVRLSAEQLQDAVDRWVEHVYHQDPHAGLGNATPFAVTAASRDALRHISDERVLDVLLAEAPDNNGRRTVAKKGIRFDGAYFIAPELERLVGRSVLVRYDVLSHDLGRLYVYDDDGFVCVAEAPERTGMDRREVAIKAGAMQRARVQAERAALKKAARKVSTDTIVEEILVSRAQASGKLASLPKPSTAHTSAGLDAAAAAVQAATATPGTSAELLQLDGVADSLARLRAVTAADQVPQARVTPTFDSVHARAQWLLQQQHQRDLTGEERQALATYRTEYTASYRRMQSAAAELYASSTQKQQGPVTGTGPG